MCTRCTTYKLPELCRICGDLRRTQTRIIYNVLLKFIKSFRWSQQIRNPLAFFVNFLKKKNVVNYCECTIIAIVTNIWYFSASFLLIHVNWSETLSVEKRLHWVPIPSYDAGITGNLPYLVDIIIVHEMTVSSPNFNLASVMIIYSINI